MGTVTTADGTEIFYKDWGSGQPIVFSHGWPLSGDDWDTQMMFFLLHGYRVVAHDRRGHGRSTQTSDGHDMDHYADDLATVTAHLDLRNAIHVGHSTGGGEVAHYIARHGAGPGHARRRRPGRSLRRLRSAVRAAGAERDAEDVPRIPPRHADHRGRDDQRRPAGLHPVLTGAAAGSRLRLVADHQARGPI